MPMPSLPIATRAGVAVSQGYASRRQREGLL